MSAFRALELSVSPGGSLVAAGASEHEVSVWDVAIRRQIGSFRSVLWKRKDLKKVQTVSMSTSGQVVYIGFDLRPCKVLQTDSGYTVSNMRAVRRVFPSHYGPFALLDKTKPEVALLPDGKRSFAIQRCSFAILDACFSPLALAISESGGPVRCFEVGSGRELWRYQQLRCHIIDLCYSGRQNAFFGVERNLRGGDTALVRLEAASGQATPVCQVRWAAAAAFCLGGEALLKSDGDIIDVASGASIGTIPFAAT
jgi:hypothetical protein